MPRWVYIVAAWTVAGISVALAARYGFKSADTTTDGIIYATMFSTIAAGGGVMQALAVHVVANAGMRQGWRVFWGLVIGAIGLAAMLATVLSSLGAIAGRADAAAAERTKASDSVKDDRADLARLTAERAALKFTPATAETVAAVKLAADKATAAKDTECDRNGKHCRVRMDDEKIAADKLTAASANKAATERAAKLDADLVAIRKRLETAPGVQAINPLAAALARLFGMSVSDAADRRDLFLAIVLELLVAGSMIGVELTREHKTPAPAEAETPHVPGMVSAFMDARLPLDANAATDIGAIFAAYRKWCGEQARAVLSAEMFGRQFGAECKRRGLTTRRQGKAVLCVGVRVA